MSVLFDLMLEKLKHHVAAMINLVAQPRWGVVTSYDNVNHLVKVTIQPEGNTSGWLPVMSPWVGAGWGEVTPLAVGQQVKLIFENGDGGNPVAVGQAYSTANPPPQAYSSPSQVKTPPAQGERVFVSGGGAMARLCANGDVYVFSPTNIYLDSDVTVTKNLTVLGDMTVLGTESGSTGAITAEGEVSDLSGVHGTVDTLRGAHNTHGHPAAPGNTITPIPNVVTP